MCKRGSVIAAIITGGATLALPIAANAEDLTASGMLKKMNDREQYHYLAGIVAGLGTARFVSDGNEEGSLCIQNWFYDTLGIRETLYAAFDKFGDKSPSAIMYALAARKCGK